MNARLALKLLGIALAVVVLVGAGAYGWAASRSAALRSRTIETHSVGIPVPFPLSEAELAELGLTDDPGDRIALERARERGRHLVDARYGCTGCHGEDFSGGVMIDAFPLGTLLGPNLTSGEGSATVGYTSRDWDRIVRHGVKPDGTPAAMPSEDFQLMSDQELSDIIAFIRSRPPKFGETPVPVSLGPLGKVLMATGGLRLSVDLIDSHDVDHVRFPPAAEVSVEFGRHLAGVCTGCHRQDLSGGPIAGGDPAWPPAGTSPHMGRGWRVGTVPTSSARSGKV